ncbi:MAG: Ig-like domain-containing protein, partial [Syntrophothermus sp.]
MVKHPEIYLQADSVWMEALVTVYDGWQNEYNVRDRNDANYWNDAAGLINNSISNDSKYLGNEFKWINCNWTKHRQNLVKIKSLYEDSSPFYSWLDLRLPLMWNALKGIGWKTSFLSASEGLYFQKRSEGKSTYIMITDEEMGYAVTIENGVLKLFDGATGFEITKTQLVGNPVLVMNQRYVWYPLMDRDDCMNDGGLNTIISQYCYMNSKPQLSSFEDTILDDMKAGTVLKDDIDKNWALLIASRFGKQNGWRSAVVREMARNLFPLRYLENRNNPSDIPYELTAMNMVITEMGNRLSPASAVMAAEACKYSPVSLTEAVKAVGSKYFQWFNRSTCAKDQEFVYGDYYKMWLPTLDDKTIAGIGDCFVEACGVGSALVIADIPGWNVWITNWWDSKNGGGHVIAGVYYNGEGKTLSNGLYNKNDGQCINGPLWSYGGKLIFPLVYKPDYGFLASGQVGPYSKFDLPFTDLDRLSAVDFAGEIASDEPELSFANGLDAQANSSKISALDYLNFIKTSSKEWMTWNMGGLLPAGSISGKITDQNNEAAGDVLVKLIDRNKKMIRSAGTTASGDYKIERIPEGDYKVCFAGKYSNTMLPLVDKWYNGKNSYDAADILKLSAGGGLSGINMQMSFDNKPLVKITSPLNGSEVSGSVVVKVNASDDNGIIKAGFYLNNKPLGEVYTAPYSCMLNTEKLPRGTYIITAKVYDTIGQVNSDSITITVLNDLPPDIRIISPANGSILTGNIIIVADASDDDLLKKLTLFVDGNKINELTEEPYQFSYDLAGLASGGHTVKISAEDAGSHVSSDEIIIYKNNPPKEEFSFYKIIGGSPAGGKFNYPQGIAADDEGNLYVADRGNDRIQKFSYDGTFIGQWEGKKLPGNPLIEPYGITVALNSFVFVANSGSIFKFTKEGKFISQWGYTGTSDGLFLGSHDIAADSYGNVYITDRDANRIQKFDINGNFILKWGQKGTANGEFNDPRGICIDENNIIYVVDIFNNRIQKFTDDGKFLGKWAFPGNVYNGWPRFWGIASDRKGHIYFSSTDNQCVIKYNTDGSIASQWGNQWGDGAGEFMYPQGIAIGKFGHVYLTDDNARVQEFSQNGTFVSQWGSLSSMEKGEFYLPVGIAQDKTGDIYVVDYYNNRI